MRVKIKLTGILFKEKRNKSDVLLPEGATVRDALEAIRGELPPDMPGYSPVVLLNGVHATPLAPLNEGDEVWLLYAPTGG